MGIMTTTRIFKNLALFPIEAVVITLFLKVLIPVARRAKLVFTPETDMSITRKEIIAQLEACRTGDFTVQELDAAKEAILSSIRSVHDSPGAIESYYSTSTLSGNRFSLQDYRAAVEQTTALQVSEAARSLQLHSSFILKGVTA